MNNSNPLDDIDLTGMTLGDVKNMENPVLRNTILKMLESEGVTQPHHTSHGMHTSHLSSEHLEIPFEKKPS